MADLPVSTTCPPSLATARAIMVPIPRDAPVTNAVLPRPRTLDELICLTPLNSQDAVNPRSTAVTLPAHQVLIALL